MEAVYIMIDYLDFFPFLHSIYFVDISLTNTKDVLPRTARASLYFHMCSQVSPAY